MLFLTSPLLLTTLVLFSNFSGNDKAPFLILCMMVVIVLIFVVTGVVTFINKENYTSRFLCLGAGVTIMYVVISILLSRAGLVDSLSTLGFR